MLTMDSDSLLPECTSCNQSRCSKLLHLMNEHRKENTKLCDVILQVNEKQYPAHRSLLAACSPYFLAMFNGDMKESSEKIVVLENVKNEILEFLVDFVYTGNMDINIENVESILEHATLLQFSEVKLLACQFLEEQLDPENCIGIRKFVHLHHCKTFIHTVDDFIKYNFLRVVNSDEFNSIPFDVLKGIISSDKLNVGCEEEVFKCVMKWIKHDPVDREPRLYDLLKETRLPLLEKHFMMENVDNQDLIKNDEKSRDLLDEAKNYHLQPEKHFKLRSPRTMPRHSTCGQLFVIGGRKNIDTTLNHVESYSLLTNKWTEAAHLKKPRQQFSVCELNKNIFAIAGSDGVNRLDSVEVLRSGKKKWKNATPLQMCRSGIAAANLGDAVFVAGGFDGRSCLSCVERFDPIVASWDFVAPMNFARSFPTAAALDKRLFTIGGNDGAEFLASCECFDPLMNRWTNISPMSTPRAGVGCAVLDDILYVAGGFDGVDGLNLVEMYDPRMDKWQIISPMKRERDGVSLVSYGGFIYAIGGIDGDSYLNTIEYYDPATDTWMESVPMELPRAAPGVAVLMSEVQV